MGSEWEVVSLKDAATFFSGGTPPKSNPEYWGGEIPWISAKSMYGSRFSDSELKLTEVGLNKGSRLAPKDATLLLVRGSMLHQRIPVGITTRAVAFNQDVKAIIPNENFLPLYFYYCFAGREHEFLSKVENTGIGAGKLDTDVLHKIKFFCPPFTEQKAIAHILGSLDDKIELNRQMNETLESMAQALFKSWFVDFDPVIDNALAAGNPIPDVFAERAKIRQEMRQAAQASNHALPSNNEHQSRFPSEFEYTKEMGWIPKGWEVGVVSDIADHIRANAKSGEITESDMYVGLEHIGKKEIFLTSAGIGSDVTSNKSRFKKFDILFGKLRPYFHKVSIAPSSGVCSTDILVFRPKKENLFSYLTLVLFSENLVEYANMRSTGTRMPRANAKDILAYSIVKLPEELLDIFEITISTNWIKGHLANSENQSLSKLRDTLLHKLLSGELRIPDAEKFIAVA